MPKFRKRPVIIDAEQYMGPSCLHGNDPEPKVPPGVFFTRKDMSTDRHPYVVTIHGQVTYIQPTDWVIAEPDGVHYYPCKANVFQASYEPVK